MVLCYSVILGYVVYNVVNQISSCLSNDLKFLILIESRRIVFECYQQKGLSYYFPLMFFLKILFLYMVPLFAANFKREKIFVFDFFGILSLPEIPLQSIFYSIVFFIRALVYQFDS